MHGAGRVIAPCGVCAVREKMVARAVCVYWVYAGAHNVTTFWKRFNFDDVRLLYSFGSGRCAVGQCCMFRSRGWANKLEQQRRVHCRPVLHYVFSVGRLVRLVE